MAISDIEGDAEDRTDLAVQLRRFSISGLFGYLSHTIHFPQMEPNASTPELLLVEGQNGTGKTTIMKMVAGITKGLNFDQFRQVPFSSAELELSTGDVLGVEWNPRNPNFPMIATFRNHRVSLGRERNQSYSNDQQEAITAYREEALPLLRSIDFELLTIDRSIEADSPSPEVTFDAKTGQYRAKRTVRTLSNRVHGFLREAQVNYRRFFQAEDLELLPRILRQFENVRTDFDPDALLMRVNAVRSRNEEISRFGLQTDHRELETLAGLLENGLHRHDPHALAVLASYVEINETRSKARELIAIRLSLFENIMDEFFVGKRIRISSRNGFDIAGSMGPLNEKDLSSGEFHFLYMMVSALLCERTGSIIAIDEPELSLHVSWQRRLIGALSKCASGASPLFFLCTHSTAISSAHRHAVQTLSAID